MGKVKTIVEHFDHLKPYVSEQGFTSGREPGNTNDKDMNDTDQDKGVEESTVASNLRRRSKRVRRRPNRFYEHVLY